jgi:hypothetical protein
MAGVAFVVEGDGVGFATESYATSALYTTLANLSGALWRIRRAKGQDRLSRFELLMGSSQIKLDAKLGFQFWIVNDKT